MIKKIPWYDIFHIKVFFIYFQCNLKYIVITTIFSNNEDIDCDVLRGLFTDIPNNNILELTYSVASTNWMDKVEEVLVNESDTLDRWNKNTYLHYYISLKCIYH